MGIQDQNLTFKYPENISEQKSLIFTAKDIKLNINIGNFLKNVTTTGTARLSDYSTSPKKFQIKLPIPGNFNINLNHNFNEATRPSTSLLDFAKNKFINLITESNKTTNLAYAGLALAGKSYVVPKLSYFQGTDPISFTLSWKLLIKNKKENIIIKNILNHFKYYSMPTKASKSITDIATERVLNSPPLWDIIFYSKGQNYFFKNNKLADLYITNVSVNYSPDGEYYSFIDGSATSVDLSVSFRTTKSILNADEFFTNIQIG